MRHGALTTVAAVAALVGGANAEPRAAADCAGAIVAMAVAAADPVDDRPALRPSLSFEIAAGGAGPRGAVADGVVLPVAAGPAAALALRTALARLAGTDVSVHAASPRLDRRGRVRGQIVTDGGRWLQADLLGAGLVAADGADGPCALALRAAEAEARASRRGLWAEGAPDLSGRPDALPDFVIAERRVHSVGKAGSTTYLNFGPVFATDFTVRIDGRISAGFDAEGPLARAAGQVVRVRGWATARDGVDLALPGAAGLEWMGKDR